MTLNLKPHPKFSGREGPLLLIVMDGIGLTKDHPGNAVSKASTPILDALLSSPLSTQIQAHGYSVGLPGNTDMGNSEVGHNALGAGRVIKQGANLINHAFDSGEIFTNPCWQETIKRGVSGKTVHLLGLLSDGNVHANIEHLFALLTACEQAGVKCVRVHTLLDGRDVAPQSALIYVKRLQARLAQINATNKDYAIASGGGRQVITMDRYNANIEMVKLGYECHAHGIGAKITEPEKAIHAFYAQNPNATDQDIPAFVVVDSDNQPIGKMQDGDAVILFNYRGDRAMQISRALEQVTFDEFDRGDHPDIYFCSIIEYDGDEHIPVNYLVSPPIINHTMIEYCCAEGLKTFAVSETQKFGHVTYFWNGNKSGYLCAELESYVEIPSDVVAFNQKPQMKAHEITQATITQLQKPGIRFGRINFANGDMVGHTGDFTATKTAVETVDKCVGELIDATTKLGGIVLVMADHGNAEEMFEQTSEGKSIKTSHTLNPVPFVIVDNKYANEYTLRTDLAPAGLANVAASVFNLLGFEAPKDYSPSLIQFD